MFLARETHFRHHQIIETKLVLVKQQDRTLKLGFRGQGAASPSAPSGGTSLLSWGSPPGMGGQGTTPPSAPSTPPPGACWGFRGSMGCPCQQQGCPWSPEVSRCPLTPPAAGFLFKALSGGISQCFRLRAVAAASSLVISSPPRAAPWFAPVPAGSPSKPTRTNLSKGKITPSKAIPGRAGAFPLQHRQPQPGRTSSGKGRPAWEGKGAGKDRGSESPAALQV